MRIVAPLKELCSNSREQCVGEDILFALCGLSPISALYFSSSGSMRSAGRQVMTLSSPMHFLRTSSFTSPGSLPYSPRSMPLALFGDHLIALTDKNVHNSLRTDDLAGRGNERRVTEVSTDARHFCEHIIVLVFCVCLLELRDKVRKHAARNLIQQRVGIDLKDLRVETASALSFCATVRKCAATSLSFSRSRPVSRLVPCSVATRDSVAG